MIQEHSAGIIPFYEVNGQRKYLLLLSNLTLTEHWEFPKGQIEKGETPKVAAAREFLEETGITQWEMIPGFETIAKYFYRRPGRLISKTVIYYLGHTKSMSVEISRESKGYLWLTVEEAKKKFFHKNMQEILLEADHFLNVQQNA